MSAFIQQPMIRGQFLLLIHTALNAEGRPPVTEADPARCAERGAHAADLLCLMLRKRRNATVGPLVRSLFIVG